MMGVVNIEEAEPGQQMRRTVKLDPRMMITFNRYTFKSLLVIIPIFVRI